jgi:hypothetical protein
VGGAPSISTKAIKLSLEHYTLWLFSSFSTSTVTAPASGRSTTARKTTTTACSFTLTLAILYINTEVKTTATNNAKTQMVFFYSDFLYACP